MKRKKFLKKRLNYYSLLLNRKFDQAIALKNQLLGAIIKRRRKDKDVNGLDY